MSNLEVITDRIEADFKSLDSSLDRQVVITFLISLLPELQELTETEANEIIEVIRDVYQDSDLNQNK